MTLWLYLHFPALQLDTLFKGEQSQAIIIVHGRKNTVVQKNKQASDGGIQLGMGLGTAASLCRDLQVLPYQQSTEQERLLEVAQWLYAVTSDLTFFKPNGLLLRVSNMLTLYGGLERYWHQLSTHLLKLDIQYHFATGYSPLAARLLARAGMDRVTDNQHILLSALKKHHINSSELSSVAREKLSRVGVNNIGQLLALPIADLAKRFDIELVNYVGRLTGEFKHPVNFYHPPEQFKRYVELLYEIENTQLLQHPINKLLTDLQVFLTLRDQVTQEVLLRLHLRNDEELAIPIASAQGEYLASKWLELIQLTLETVVLSAPVLSLTLEVLNARARHVDGMDLFAGNQSTMDAAELVSLLQAKMGADSIKGIMLNDDYRPEKATQFCTPLSTEQHTYDRAYGIRPSILLPEPQPLTEKVSLIQGPERLVTGWWDNNEIVRDYFIGRNPKGQWLWLFRTPTPDWFVHGIFS